MEDVISKSQGVFLWAALMTKELKKGARNADTIEELREILLLRLTQLKVYTRIC